MILANIDDYRRLAQRRLPKFLFEYIDGGAFSETTLRANCTDLQTIRLRQNGVVRQDSVTSDMIFPTPFIIEFVSSIMTLEPGDVIITGTPAGVGPMKSGDRIEVEISGIGKLENVVQ